ncbi:hypothetical protein EGW08_010753 [Elysia chlorotica]|uniref:Uncharacterized protein n=1 Tax=Elysia chlorotica TaxID=188477 RepID=A0A433TIT3_ELYCH|nr:hypothetical protein EGW08_010753 [Elysia chlorotica]
MITIVNTDPQARFRKMFGSRYNLHVALAWSNRENNPELVQDEHKPQARLFYESKEMLLRELEASSLAANRTKPQGRIVSTSAVLGPANWRRRSQRDKKNRGDAATNSLDNPTLDKDMSTLGVRGRPVRLAPIQSQANPFLTREVTQLHKGFGLIRPEQMEFLAQYQAFTNTRKLLEDEGFFDAQLGRANLAGEQFGFNQQEELLDPTQTPKERQDELGDFSTEVAQAGQKEREKAGRRVVISARPPATTVLPRTDLRKGGVGDGQPGSAVGQNRAIYYCLTRNDRKGG